MYKRVTDEEIRLLKIIAPYSAKTIPLKLVDDAPPEAVEALRRLRELGREDADI